MVKALLREKFRVARVADLVGEEAVRLYGRRRGRSDAKGPARTLNVPDAPGVLPMSSQ